MFELRKVIFSTVSFAALATAGFPQVALAQDTAAPATTGAQNCDDLAVQTDRDACLAARNDSQVGQPANSIVVTGSRIARRGYDTVEPVQVVSNQQIEARGFNTLGQALNELPSFGVPIPLRSAFNRASDPARAS